MTPKNSAKMTRIVAWGFVVVAVVWGLAPYQGINEPARLFLDLLHWPFGDAAPILNQSEMWLSSIGAGLTAALCIMLLGVVVPAIERSDKKTVRVTIWAFIAWYVIDSVGSAFSGIPSNAFFNAILLVPLLIPLCTLRYEEQAE